MADTIVSTGRGGTGKSTFVALAARFLKPPVLLIDLDPDESLADMLGFDLYKHGKNTISDKLYEILEAAKAGGGEDASLGFESMTALIEKECLYKGNHDIDLISLGAKLTKGCYCTPDDILKNIIPKMIEKYENVVIDSPAGLEHLNRKVVSDVDHFFVILDPSSKSLQHIGRIRDIANELKIKYANFYLLGNYNFNEEKQTYFESSGEKLLGRIEPDPKVGEYNLSGQSLLDLQEDSPASLSVKRILDMTDIAMV